MTTMAGGDCQFEALRAPTQWNMFNCVMYMFDQAYHNHPSFVCSRMCSVLPASARLGNDPIVDLVDVAVFLQPHPPRTEKVALKRSRHLSMIMCCP